MLLHGKPLSHSRGSTHVPQQAQAIFVEAIHEGKGCCKPSKDLHVAPQAVFRLCLK